MAQRQQVGGEEGPASPLKVIQVAEIHIVLYTIAPGNGYAPLLSGPPALQLQLALDGI